MTETTAERLEELNHSPADHAAAQLAACNAATRWVGEVLAGRPYPDAAALLAAADRAARNLGWADVRQALDAHPRIGDQVTGGSAEAAWSRREQAGVGDSAAATRDALRAGNHDYEQRFGHVFLIRAAGRGADEILAELRRRLGNQPARERAEVTEQLAQITRLRLERLLAS
ncbi:2-oxo-4-hydroxy-4-carboxy-5-ureidoimidazoline decarboxylase [Pseudonocardia kunmingensis]|uniref:2-oxo-4-hydroxy-4-carboxy-5-ureidoimidazoline decarboxylase n=1 Tax=Pseudonocardia kunmingensis TaxID=630975 RepID=A0A543CXI0_9PSEU|nr:2-oxo-4-hydroxy-4-carboxy-5-ureidoimidazoline decarboxylase [Pseudonocardia kunmingensis]TQM01813.1 2-oxo-4-hydroxy-4-carboxy-5-ureidoimidazoline decarboxylase [Pseudonocardia kunmingensis]